MTIEDVKDIEDIATAAGSKFFSQGALSFFKSVIYPEVYAVGPGYLFVTSEQREEGPRRYTIRGWEPTEPEEIITVSDFGYHKSLEEAVAVIKDMQLIYPLVYD